MLILVVIEDYNVFLNRLLCIKTFQELGLFLFIVIFV